MPDLPQWQNAYKRAELVSSYTDTCTATYVDRDVSRVSRVWLRSPVSVLSLYPSDLALSRNYCEPSSVHIYLAKRGARHCSTGIVTKASEEIRTHLPDEQSANRTPPRVFSFSVFLPLNDFAPPAISPTNQPRRTYTESPTHHHFSLSLSHTQTLLISLGHNHVFKLRTGCLI